MVEHAQRASGTTDAERETASGLGWHILNKVPEVTIYFWLIKVLCTTVGETAADLLNERLNFGLTHTTYVMGSLLLITLLYQFRLKKYIPGAYWLAVVLISVVGTLITDNLTDHFGVSLVTSTVGFSIALAATFVIWYAVERTLSVHTIITVRREAFYWFAILFTFALGTAAGDLIAEKCRLGYLVSALLFGGLIAAVAVIHLRLKVNTILTFWIAYILTRPLGASIGDYLSQARENGGLGLGTIGTSVLFLAAILGGVIFLAITRKDATENVLPQLVLQESPADEVMVSEISYGAAEHGAVVMEPVSSISDVGYVPEAGA